MLSKLSKSILGLIATAMVTIFVLGLAHSISTGFAGFWGGLPFWIISISVLAMTFYDYWNECLRKE